jgi:hypothetical protein
VPLTVVEAISLKLSVTVPSTVSDVIVRQAPRSGLVMVRIGA